MAIPPEPRPAESPDEKGCDSDSGGSDNNFGLPFLFEEESDDEKITSPAAKSPENKTRILERRGDWSVVEMRKPGDIVARWITCGGLSAALDQTRVEYRAEPDVDGDGSPRFFRDRLNAGSHQVMALMVALVLARHPGKVDHSVCVLGGGGLALPMALLAQEPVLKLQVVELEADAIELAKRHFGARDEPRLELVAGDALDFVVANQVRPGILTLNIDIDFLRGCQPPPKLLSSDFWSSAWNAVRLGQEESSVGIITLNAIGTDEESLMAVASHALQHAKAQLNFHLAAAVLEPLGEKVRSTWTAFVPRPSILLLGPRELLELLAEGNSPILQAALEKVPWSTALAGPLLRELQQKSGLLARFRWLESASSQH